MTDINASIKSLEALASQIEASGSKADAVETDETVIDDDTVEEKDLLEDEVVVEEEEVVTKASASDLLAQMDGPVIDMGEQKSAIEEVVAEDFLCGFQRKSVNQPCSFCQGGCSAEDGMPGLKTIEDIVTKAYVGSEVLSSGYSNTDDIFVVDVKGDDGAREYFLSGEGHELGWLRLDEEVAVKSADGVAADIIDRDGAAKLALKTIDGQVMGVDATTFLGEDAYVVEIEDEGEKSFDVFVALDGKVLGYDEFSLVDDSFTEEETSDLKALEAELHFKRLYSRERREELAKSGEAMEDGSFPIVDGADLQNAIVAYGKAADPEVAKAHIVKRAADLELTDSLPEGWVEGKGSELPDEELDEESDEAVSADTDEVPVEEAAPEAAPDVSPAVDPDVDPELEEDEEEEKTSFEAELAEFKTLANELGLS